MKAGKIAIGHPVDVASGVQFTAAHDVAIGGEVPLTWRRLYSTALLDRPPGVQGRGWIHCFDARLVREDAGFVFFGHDGLRVEFDDPEGLVDAGKSVFHFGEFMELRREEGYYAIYHWHGWEHEVHKFMFPSSGTEMRLFALQLPSGMAVHLLYNEQGRLEELRQTIEGRRLLLDYNLDGSLAGLSLASRFTAPRQVIKYEYDGRKRLVAVRNAAGTGTVYGYDDQNRLISETGPMGGDYRMRYDATGKCVETSGRDRWMYRRLDYNELQRETRVVDSLGHSAIYNYNAEGQVTEVRLPNGGRERTDFDRFGRVLTRVGPSGEIMCFGYGPRGDITEITYPNGGTVVFEYNLDHQPLQILQPDGGAWRFRYERGAMVEHTDPAGAVTRFERDSLNQIVVAHTAAGNRIRLKRNTEYSNLCCEDEYGLLVRYEYDGCLGCTEVHDARGLLRAFHYDAVRHLMGIAEADGTVRRVQCNALGLVTHYGDASGRAVVYDYDVYGRLLRIVNPNGEAYDYTWDTEGRLKEIRNPKGEREEYAYDSVGNLILRRSFGGQAESYEFDVSSRCVRRHKADATILTYDFDQGGNAVRVSVGPMELATNKFDLLHRLLETTTPDATVKFEYDTAGQVLAEIQSDGRIETRHHPFGGTARRELLRGMTGPLFLDYDRRRRLIGIRDARGVLVAFEYDAANLLIRRRLGAWTETLDYDAGRRVSRQILSTLYRTSTEREFAYDEHSYLTKATDSSLGDTHYAYDAAGRLVQSEVMRTAEVNHYHYDACGNLLTRKPGAVLRYAQGNQLVENGAAQQLRDANGNLVAVTIGGQTTSYSWNAFDQLVGIRHPDGTETLFGYDGLGRRVWKQHSGSRTRFLWSRRDLVAEQTEGHLTEYFVGNFQPQLAWEDGQLRYFVLSPSSRPTELVDRNGALLWTGKFDDWGLPLCHAPPGRIAVFGLAAQYWDSETRLFYNRFRYYSPEDGRFISPDPIRTHGGLNEFLYGVNLINWLDPLGLSCGLTHMQVVVNPNIQGRGGDPDPTMADWQKKQDAFNNGVQQGIDSGNPLTIPSRAQYQADRAVGNTEARDARTAQGMGPGVQADHPVDLSCGGGQGQALYPLAGGVNGSFGSQLGPQAAARPTGSPTPKVDLYDQNGNLIRSG